MYMCNLLHVYVIYVRVLTLRNVQCVRRAHSSAVFTAQSVRVLCMYAV